LDQNLENAESGWLQGPTSKISCALIGT